MAGNASPNADELTAFGKIALEQGWHDQARECFQQALASDATNREAMKGLAQVDEMLSRQEAMPAKPMRLYSMPQATCTAAGFSVSGCIVSFLATLGCAITVGLSVLFIVTVIAVDILWPLGLLGGESEVSPTAFRTVLAYMALFGIVWWAIYRAMRSRKST